MQLAQTMSMGCSCLRYSSDHSISDAVVLAENLGVEYCTIAIEPGHVALMEMLASSYDGKTIGLAEENLQSRLRAVTLMGLSNAFGWLLLNTGNKSESSVGYSTLYGDSAGGYAVIKDVSKLLVYRLCRYRNERAGRELIPENVLVKPPSAELRPDQRDDQSLPPYEELDPILAMYVEGDHSIEEIIAAGHNRAVVERIVGLVDLAEYKRRQSPPGPRDIKGIRQRPSPAYCEPVSPLVAAALRLTCVPWSFLPQASQSIAWRRIAVLNSCCSDSLADGQPMSASRSRNSHSLLPPITAHGDHDAGSKCCRQQHPDPMRS